jgi:hypothetical protein
MRVVWHDKKAIGAEKKPEANVFIKNLNQKVLFPNFVLLMLLNLGCEQCSGSGIRCLLDPGSGIRRWFFPDP